MLTTEELSNAPGQSFDFVLLIDVFEHLDHPTGLLKRLAQLLRPGGRLILVTGYGDARVCRMAPAQFWYFRLVEHLVMLTQRHLLWLESVLGLTLESCEQVSHYQRSFSETTRQWGRQIAYWTLRKGGPWTSPLLRFSSTLQKADKWECAPQLDVTHDHVVAVYHKPTERK